MQGALLCCQTLTLPRAHMSAARTMHCCPSFPSAVTNQSRLMARSRFCCSLHSCQANDGLFSGTSSKLSCCCCCQALSQQNIKHRTLPGTLAACPPPGAFLLPCIHSPPHAASHRVTVMPWEGQEAFGQFCNAVSVQHFWSPCPGHRGHPCLLLPGQPLPAGGFGSLPGQGCKATVPSLEGQNR